MFKLLVIPSSIIIFSVGIFSCQPTGNNSTTVIDPETEKLQREVDSLREVKEALQDELNTVKEDEAPHKTIPEVPSNAADGPLDGLTVLSAKKQFDANFNPILRITFRNYAAKSIASSTIAVDFSFNSNELSPNCHFEKTLSLNLAPDANQTITLPIPAGYDKNCADKAWVVVKAVVFSDGTKK